MLFDLKIMDEALAREQLRMNMPRVLDNFTRLVEAQIPLIPRVPLIPGFTLNEENFRQILAFLAPLSCAKFIFCRSISSANQNIIYWEKMVDVDD